MFFLGIYIGLSVMVGCWCGYKTYEQEGFSLGITVFAGAVIVWPIVFIVEYFQRFR